MAGKAQAFRHSAGPQNPGNDPLIPVTRTEGARATNRICRVKAICPPESTGELHNPDRGFYTLYRYTLGDEDYSELLLSVRSRAEDALGLLEVNLRRYRLEALPPAALALFDALLSSLSDTGKRWLLRFLYDWDGRNMETEPPLLALISLHMRALGEIVTRHARCVFCVQGLFVGNWGEMNGSLHLHPEALRTLARALAGAVEEPVFLSVRTCAQWRCVTEALPQLAGRLGLYNDGLFGSETDLGSYAAPGEGEDALGRREREDELRFQEVLCRTVPNGGEAVGVSPYSAFDAAVALMRRTHISYLNRGYDLRTYEVWKRHCVHSGDVWDGTDGLTYIEQHLGYRFALRTVSLRARLFGALAVSVQLANVGFAPCLRPLRAELTLCDGQERRRFPLSGELGALANGETATLHTQLSPAEWGGRACEVFLRLVTCEGGERIRLGNEAEGGDGCLIGRLGGT